MNRDMAHILESVRDTGNYPERTPEQKRRWFHYWGFTSSHYQNHVRLTPHGQEFLKQCRGEPVSKGMTVHINPLGYRIERHG
jgi:hypothetical protein